MTTIDQEDVFDPPSSWRRTVLPRRDGRLAPLEVKLDPTAAANFSVAIVKQRRDDLDALLRQPGADPGLARAVYDTVTGTRVTPSGAGGLAACSDAFARWSDRGFEAFVDHWWLEYGPAFAVEAVVELFAITATPLARRPLTGWQRWSGRRDAMARRARTLLATAGDADVAATRQRLGEYRRGLLAARVVTSFLLPSERGWVLADTQEVEAGGAIDEAPLLIESVADPALLARLVAVCRLSKGWGSTAGIRSSATPITVADGVGPSSAIVMAAWLDDPYTANKDQKTPVASVLAHFPTDEAFQVLLDRGDRPVVRTALLEAARRFPRRALRLFGEAADRGRHRDLFRSHVLSHPDLAEAALCSLRDGVASLVKAQLGERASAAEPAADGALPAILRDPPWRRGKKPPKPAVVGGLQPPTGTSCVWLPEEQESWMRKGDPMSPDEVKSALAKRNTRYWSHQVLRALPFAEREEAVSIMRSWRPDTCWDIDSLLAIAAAYATDAHDLIVDTVRAQPRELATAIAPYESMAVVSLVAGWHNRRTLRSAATVWLRRHAAFTAKALIPSAVGKPGPERKASGNMLRFLVNTGNGDEVMSAAQRYGDRAAAAVAEVLATDPADVLPARMPALPPWVSAPLLPPVLLADGRRSLPPAAVEHLLTMLLLSRPGAPYAGIERVKCACDQASLANAAWMLFEQWRAAGAPTKDGWVFEALGVVGDDRTVERLLTVIRHDTSDPRVVSALDVFVAIGSDAALLALKELSEKVKTKRVRQGALAKIGEVAEGLGLTADQLADRLLPDLGLDADGTTVLDYGPRRFIVGFDEQLRPTVRDEDGARRKDLPKPGTRDDPHLAPAAEARFRKLKKDARAIGADQIRRLERAMVDGRRFSLHELTTLFVGHPLRWHVTRRLVWATFDHDAPTGSFRVAEDRTFADARDAEVIVADDASIAVAHPVHLGADLGPWADLFNDYDLLQPFPQLGREVFEPAFKPVDDMVGARIESLRFLGLVRRGWLPPETGDGGRMSTFIKPLPQGRTLVLDVEPGVYAGDPKLSPEQEVRSVTFTGGTRRAVPVAAFDDLGPVTASEVLRDLIWLQS